MDQILWQVRMSNGRLITYGLIYGLSARLTHLRDWAEDLDGPILCLAAKLALGLIQHAEFILRMWSLVSKTCISNRVGYPGEIDTHGI